MRWSQAWMLLALSTLLSDSNATLERSMAHTSPALA